MNKFNVSGIKNSDPILDDLKGAVDSKKKQFNSAVSSVKSRIIKDKHFYNSHLDAFTDRRFEPLVYLNLAIDHKTLFDKKPTKLRSFNDKRLMNLLTILADDEFWNMVYTPLAKKYNTYIEEINHRNSDLSFESSFSAMANVSKSRLNDASVEKSIILRVLYFLMCGNPYGSLTLGSDLNEEKLVKSLHEIVQRLRFEIQLLENRLVEINFFINTVQHSDILELDLTYKCYCQFIIDELTKCFNVFSPLSKIWGGVELLDAEDLIELWGGSKKSFMNERAKKESFLYRSDYGNFQYSKDDAIEWLTNKKALGANPFNVMNHKKDIEVSDLDESVSKLYPEVSKPRIKVFGVGGGGCNAVANMINQNVEGMDFICANTDTQALSEANGAITLKLGNGLGAGTNPDVGRKAAESDRLAIEELLSDTDLVFIVAGMGGGTGTGAAPVVASIAKDLGVLSVAIVTKPFKFEGKIRMSAAEKGLASLVEEVDSLVTIPNQKLYEILGEDTLMQDAFAKADDVLKSAIQGISNIIVKKGFVNVGFENLRVFLSNSGNTIFLQGKDKTARLATSHAIKNDDNLRNARGVLVNITAAKPTLGDQTEVADIVEEIVHEDANIIYGIVDDKSLGDDILVTIFLNVGKYNYKMNPLEKIGTRSETADSKDEDLMIPTFLRNQ